ncbi:protein mono-ADP-ribosyltransferase PARP3-like [Paramacrobiotus metropolitanus]|uniref:protein mono-ADP-ribosyltransferase PARP3-like n=1 Tax=Paramacrobiotus metropolitanus TaxID=2943436 RepID=UPI002445A042|nr:protein mono-ADP-ribosyltransferase PARP3-like [Paramacrobiotus metropolitanus]
MPPRIDATAINEKPGVYTAVYKDYAFVLNQTNITDNNNKFYIGQILRRNDKSYDVFTKWGRVGEEGRSQLVCDGVDADTAVAEFKEKFRDKSGTTWEKRDYEPKSGKLYTLLEMASAGDHLDKALQNLNLDATNLPLGAICANQIVRGREILDKVEEALDTLIDLSDQYYSLIPHAFNRSTTPPVINTIQSVRTERDMLHKLN